MVGIRWAAGVAALALSCSILGASAPAGAVQVPQEGQVAEQPSAKTPHVLDGDVLGIVQIGSRIFAGGNFASVASPDRATTYPRANLMAFDAATGRLDAGFAPELDGGVWALLPAADNKSVYVVGAFNTVNGVRSKSIARLDVATGKAVPGFAVPGINGVVRDIRTDGTRLYLGGTFTQVRGQGRPSVVAISAATGALDPFFGLTFAAPRNGGAIGVYKLDITPDGKTLVAIGNFTTVDGLPRDQAVMADLSGDTAAVSSWSTTRYQPACADRAYDSYVRDIDFAPDGSYFVVVSTGGGFAGTLCDTAARWETARSGAGQEPTWVDYTGGDTLHSVAITGSVVYVGGHQRWLNNPFKADAAGQGAVSREGVAALDPRNGLPLSWNPGRSRGVGARELYATPTGLWVGSDTDRFNQQYRGRMAFVPLAGGKSLPADTTGVLPNEVFLAGPRTTVSYSNDLQYRRVDTSQRPVVGANVTAPAGGTSWGAVRAAFMTDNTLWTGGTNGTFQRRTFDGRTPGVATTVPLNGLTDFSNELRNATGMFFWNGRVYYTQSGQSSLYYRYFTPESGIVGAQRFTATDSLADLDWRRVAGMTLAGDRLLWADSGNGVLRSAPFVGGLPTTGGTVLSGSGVDGKDWRARALFLRPGGAVANAAPVAKVATSCLGMACQFDSAGTTDADGTVKSYSWNFGDGSTATGATASRTYRTAGTYTVTLTATDNEGLVGTATAQLEVAPNRAPTASFTSTCSATVCRFDGGASSDPDGSISSYAWDFGDGTTGTDSVVTHTFDADRTYPVRLTVTDAGGLTGETTRDVVVDSSAGVIAFRGSAVRDVNGTSASVTVPASVQADDGMLLAVTSNGTIALTEPAGWQLVDRVVNQMTTSVYQRVAVADDAGTTVGVTAPSTQKINIQLLAYRGTSTTAPVATAAKTAEAAGLTSHTTPDVAVTDPGAWVVSYWADKSSATTAWMPPADVTSRVTLYGTGAGRVTSLSADSGGPVTTGTYGGRVATTDAASGRSVTFTVVLAPQR
ncbi:MAG: domain containing protein [Cryptosporangiaceae bacterium]|nr:domain containing protein [Cryptosporangiaceae bacterium]